MSKADKMLLEFGCTPIKVGSCIELGFESGNTVNLWGSCKKGVVEDKENGVKPKKETIDGIPYNLCGNCDQVVNHIYCDDCGYKVDRSKD